MELWQIVDAVYGIYDNRMQLPASRVFRYISRVQQMAFNRDCRAFERTGSIQRTGSGGTSSTHPFPEDCRTIREVAENDVYVELFERRIISKVPRQSLSVVYYYRPPELTHQNTSDILDSTFRSGTEAQKAALFQPADNSRLVIPVEWRWPLLVQPASALSDNINYGDKTPQVALEPYFEEWWKAMDARRNDRKPVMSLGAFAW